MAHIRLLLVLFESPSPRMAGLEAAQVLSVLCLPQDHHNIMIVPCFLLNPLGGGNLIDGEKITFPKAAKAIRELFLKGLIKIKIGYLTKKSVEWKLFFSLESKT